jgi:hypothetical protein
MQYMILSSTYRERTVAQLRQQATALRTDAASTPDVERRRLLSLAGRYDDFADLREAEERRH